MQKLIRLYICVLSSKSLIDTKIFFSFFFFCVCVCDIFLM